MERRGILIAVLLVSLILISSFIVAEDNDVKDNQDTNLPEDVGKGVEGIKDIKGKTEKALEENIKVPENLQVPARIIFGIKGEISLQHFIVLLAVWIMLFLIISSILKITPFFEGWKSWVGAVVITCLVAISGAIRSVSIFFLNLGNSFEFLEKWSVLKIVFALIIVAILFYGVSILIKMLNRKVMISEAEQAGMEAGAGARMLKWMYKMFRGE